MDTGNLIGEMFAKMFPDEYMKLAQEALKALQISFFMQSVQMGGMITAAVRQQDKCDSLQRMEHIVDALDSVSDAPVGYAVAIMTCGCALMETMTDHVQHFCDEHAELIGDDLEALKSFTAKTLFDAYKDDLPDTARDLRDAHLKAGTGEGTEINLSDTLEKQLQDLLGENK